MESLPLNILVHEFVTGGGWQGRELETGLAAEGLAMLRAVLKDFQSWGHARLTTTLDRRLAGLRLPADRIVNLSHEAHIHALHELISSADAALVIAPETDGILARLSALAEDANVPLLGSDSRAVSVAADKWECFCRFAAAGLTTPNTWRVRRAEAGAKAVEFGFPLVVKPLDGLDCEGVSLVRDPASLHRALGIIPPGHEHVLLQRYRPGTHASVSLLASANGILALSLNEQQIVPGIPFRYQGGVIPLKHPLRETALEHAVRAASLVPGLRGYFGVDLVLTEKECNVIEINPRLTTSYVGLRRVIRINLAEAIWRACVEGTLPPASILSGKAVFHKEDLHGCQ